MSVRLGIHIPCKNLTGCRDEHSITLSDISSCWECVRTAYLKCIFKTLAIHRETRTSYLVPVLSYFRLSSATWLYILHVLHVRIYAFCSEGAVSVAVLLIFITQY